MAQTMAQTMAQSQSQTKELPCEPFRSEQDPLFLSAECIKDIGSVSPASYRTPSDHKASNRLINFACRMMELPGSALKRLQEIPGKIVSPFDRRGTNSVSSTEPKKRM
jgi:hypothetical protein